MDLYSAPITLPSSFILMAQYIIIIVEAYIFNYIGREIQSYWGSEAVYIKCCPKSKKGYNADDIA